MQATNTSTLIVFSGFGIHIVELLTGKVGHEFFARFIDIGKYSCNILSGNEILLQMIIGLWLAVTVGIRQ